MPNKQDIQGRVEGANENGVKINGAWYNFSKFFKGERQPSTGVAVSAVVDEFKGKQYLNELAVIGSALPNGGGNTPSTASYASGGFSGRSSDTNERIARQVALKAAVHFHASDDTVASTVIGTARIFEKFLAEPYGEGDVEAAA